MKLGRQQIYEQAIQVLEANPQGIRWSDLVREVEKKAPGTPRNSIRGAVHAFLKKQTSEVIKVARGTYRLVKFVEEDDVQASAEEHQVDAVVVQTGSLVSEVMVEQDFYQSFADWLEENDEATVAAPLGGSVLGGKWGTPDVLGILKPRAQDIFKFEPQIVSAEIKVAPNQPVVAFGQAVAYRLFSHRSYIVVPDSTGSDDMSRLKSLCSIHGVGLVTFVVNKNQPDYTVIVLPVNASPDMFYVNSMLERLKSSEPELLNKLF